MYGLLHGITYVLPHLFYLPIILTAYYYPRHGVPLAVVLSVCYCLVSFTLVSPTTAELISALARSAVFIVIAGVVSHLSARMHHDTRMCRRLVFVVKSSNDAIIGETPEDLVSDWNTGAERVFGYTSEENLFLHPRHGWAARQCDYFIKTGFVIGFLVVRDRREDFQSPRSRGPS